MNNLPNSHRNIVDNNNPELTALMYQARNLALKYGYVDVLAYVSQATVDLIEDKFMRLHQLDKRVSESNINEFIGDHKHSYTGKKGTVYRSDEYSLTFDESIARLQYLKSIGLDGKITGESIHLPGRTFGIIAYEK